MNIKQSIGLSSLLLTSVMAHAGVSGTVFQDIPLNGTAVNTYGTKDTNEQGVAGVIVTASPSNETTTTAADGTWSLNTTGKVKVEFTKLPAYLAEGKGQSSVQFIDGDSSTVNLALYNPSDYAKDAKNSIAMTAQANSTLNDKAVSLRILDGSATPDGNNDIIPTTTDITFDKLGTVWGLAYDSAHKNIYTAAVVRRHGAIGPGGLGAIYKIDKDSNVETFVTVAGVGTIPTDRNLSTDPTQPSHDPVFDEVGRVGLGDIDISEDGKTLYTVNVNANTLIAIDIASKTQKVLGIPNPFGAGCPATDVKSWGIGQNKGKVYVGSVCTSNTTEGAAISQLNGESFTTVHKIPLNMDGENSLDGNEVIGKRWNKWITDPIGLFDNTKTTRMSKPAPILSDIVFDEKGGMILGFADRTGMQAGVRNYSPKSNDNSTYYYDAAGDIYKVCRVNNAYVNEGNASCPQNDTTGHEFFTEEEWIYDVNNTNKHLEIALGGLTYLQGSHTILTSAFDPVTSYDSSGIIWMNTETGKRTSAQRMLGGNGSLAYNGKAGGIGDLELLTPAAPTEIGNRVWFDDNSNCMQDANETGIAGVEVNLYDGAKCEGSAVKTATTDANGLYSFDVEAGKAYSVCINGAADQSPLKDTKLTCNSGGTPINNSDASLVGKDAKVAVVPLNTGANNHSFDFGFAPVAVAPTPVVTPQTPVVTPTPEVPVNRDVNHTDGSCDCHSYEESSAPALNGLGMIGLVFLTSFAAFLFRRELNEVAN